MMGYVIPIENREQVELAVENALQLGYKHHNSLWDLLVLIHPEMNCIYLYDDGVFSIHAHSSLDPDFERVGLDVMLSTIKPFQNSDDVGNT